MKRVEVEPKHYQTFEDLEVYQAAREFRKAMYRVAEELLDDLSACIDQNYCPPEEIEKLKSEGWRVHQMINAYIRFLRGRTLGSPSRVQECPADGELSEDEINDLFFGPFNASAVKRLNE